MSYTMKEMTNEARAESSSLELCHARRNCDEIEMTNNPQQIAACGLYCGACKKFLNGKCPGCKENEKASWCKIRKCCQEKGFHTCAECDKDVKECKIHNNFVGKIFAFLFNSDRAACIRYIRENGEDAFAEKMAKDQQMTMKRE